MHSFFLDATVGGNILPFSYNYGLVFLSLLVAIFSATMALQTAYVARHAMQNWHRYVAISTGAIALGGGIWTMHFIGMLAFELCTPVGYRLGMTALSIVPALVASWITLYMLSRMTVSKLQLITGGVLVGSGVGAMHYSGMAAMRMAAELRYDPAYFALSIVVAIVLATISLGIRFKLRRWRVHRIARLLISGAIMGMAIAGMHYIGMSAARFIGDPDARQGLIFIDSTFASLALSTFTITVTVLVTATNGLLRYRQTLEQMRESESRIRAIVETAVDGIITMDGHGIVQDMNRSAERLFGWHASEVIGRNINMLMPEPDRSGHDGYLRNFLSNGAPKIIGQGREVNALHKDGYVIPVRLAVGQVELPRAALFVGFLTDISERRALEASLREVAAKAEYAAAAKTAFLANMSHEIRTPMNAIIGFSELLLKTRLEPLQHSHLSIVHQSARSLLGLLNDVLDTTKLEKGAVTLEEIDFSLLELAQQVMAELRLSAENKKLILNLDYPDQMVKYFKGDSLRIRQVLINLLGNAIKFTEHGKVDLRIYIKDGLVRLEVADTGIGISEQQLRHIFEPFSQADASISRRFGGTGLGTTIARQLVDLMDGTIEVQSVLGQGSVFTVSLPLDAGQKPQMRAASMSSGNLPAMKVLIADDVPQNLELLTHLLQNAGHQVVAASDGAKAVALFASGEKFDLILMDVQMPHVDGLEATRRIRAIEASRAGTKPIAIIALTASVMEADRRAARAAGMDGFARKPIEVARLRAEVARVLGIEAAAMPEQAVPERADTDIDWHAGIAAWGSKPRMAQAIRNFLTEQAQRHPLPASNAVFETIDWERVVQSLHGISGAAANLRLLKVSALSAQLEKDAKQPSQALLAQFVQLQSQMAQVQAALALIDTAEPHSVAAPQDQAALSQDDILALIGALRQHFSHSELDESSFSKLTLWLDQQGMSSRHTALTSAIDNFDFAGAMTLLDQLHELVAQDSGTQDEEQA